MYPQPIPGTASTNFVINMAIQTKSEELPNRPRSVDYQYIAQKIRSSSARDDFPPEMCRG